MDLKSWLPGWAMKRAIRPRPIGLRVEVLEDRTVPTISFGSPSPTSNGVNSPQAVLVADVDGDGIPDLIIANGGKNSNGVTVQSGIGDGTFFPFPDISVSTPSAVTSMTLADVTGDGIPDLIVGLAGTSPGIEIFPGTGDFNGFDTTNVLKITTSNPVVGIAVAVPNLNGSKFSGPVADSPASIIVAENTAASGIEIFEGVTAGGMPTTPTGTVAAFTSPNKDYSFGAAVTFATKNNPTSLAVADLNGDKWPDLVVGESSATTGVEIFPNSAKFKTAGTTFTPLPISATTFNTRVPYSTAAPVTSVAVGPQTTAAPVPLPSIVVGTNNGSNAVQFFQTNMVAATPAPTINALSFASPQTYALSAPVTDLAFVDVDLDGNTDIVAATSGVSSSSIQILPGTPAGANSFGSAISVDDGGLANGAPRFISVVDTNNDGLPDLDIVATVSSGNNQSWILNTSGQTPPSFPPVPPPPAVPPTQGYLNQLYLDLLGRPIDPEGLTFWGNALASGTPRITIARNLANSTEGLTYDVQKAYLEFLNRPADPVGQIYYVQQMQVGLPLADVEAEMAASAEFVSQGGTFLANLYQRGLKRSLDLAGSNYWSGLLNSGRVSEYMVASMILQGGERASIITNFQGTAGIDLGWYESYLGRLGDPLGLTFWDAQLSSQLFSYQEVLAEFVSTNEFFNHAAQ